MTARFKISKPLVVSLLLVAVTFAVYFPVSRHGFITYDDNEYVTENAHVQAGLSRQGLAWAFTARSAGNWHPLTWVSHMLDCELYGMNPGGHHLTSLVLHLLNAWLLFLLLHSMTGTTWRSGLAAALFALHPLHVESVAWIAERKDVLSTFFFLLTMLAYARYAKRPGPWAYGGCLVLFCFGLMSKPMVVTLPFVLLLMDLWPLARIRRLRELLLDKRRILIEKIPFMALALLACAITVQAQKHGGAFVAAEAFAASLRLANAVCAYAAYLIDTIIPAGLAVFYPFPIHLPLWQPAGSLLLLTAISWAVFRSRRSARWAPVGWLWYLGTLVPVIGLVQVGLQARADRYTYIPSIGLCILLAWSLHRLAETGRTARLAVSAGAVVLLGLLAFASNRQVRLWQSPDVLYAHAIRVTSGNYVMHNNLGQVLLARGDYQRAREHFIKAAQIKPDCADCCYNLGIAHQAGGDVQAAEAAYRQSVQADPTAWKAHNNLGVLLAKSKRNSRAIEHFTRAIEENPRFAEAYFNRSRSYRKTGDKMAAVADYKRALEISLPAASGEAPR